MKLIFLGSGSAYTVGGDNFQSNMMLVAENGRRLLIDCGSDVRWSLARQGLTHCDVTDIYISHLHADHVGGLEHIGFLTKFDPSCDRPRLHIEASLVEPLWNGVLRGGMGVIDAAQTSLETFFDVRPLTAHQPFAWGEASLEPVRTIHVSSPGETMHSYGLFIENGDHRTFLTTDTKYTPSHLAGYYANADLVFHDCETASARSDVHAHYDDLVHLPSAVRAKTWLYH
jgi:ribonuclease BN (tRNA processing enzyme)